MTLSAWIDIDDNRHLYLTDKVLFLAT